MCAGHSGSGVIDQAGGILTAIVSAESYFSNGACNYNVFAPQVNRANANSVSCERASGGVSLLCLSSYLPA